jgi:putative DNA primase/helicase
MPNDARIEPGAAKLHLLAKRPSPKSAHPRAEKSANKTRECKQAPLRIVGGARADLAAMCTRILGVSRRVFIRGNSLVRVTTAAKAQRTGVILPQARDVKRSPNMLVIVPAAREWLQTTLTDDPGFERYHPSTSEWKPADCPAGVAAAVVTLGEWPNVASLLGVATAPFLRSDGTICAVDGYDPASMMLLRQNEARVAIAENPTRVDALHALKTLLAPFAEFPFAKTPKTDADRESGADDKETEEDSHRAAFLALLLTLVTRHLCECAPAFMISAAAAGTGKTLLAECAALIATGVDVGTRTMPSDAEEMRKSLTGAAIMGDQVIIFDNVVDGAKLSSSPLEQFITAGTHRDRVLGTSNSTVVPNVATIVITGNNITMRGALVRRTLPVRIIATVENPEERTFRIADLKGYIRANRAVLVGAVLTLLRAYVVAGMPPHGKPALGSFEAWDAIVRGAVIWAGLPDPVATQAEARAADDETAAAPALLAALEQFQIGRQGDSVTVAEVRSALPGPSCEELREALEAAGAEIEKFGYWLREHVDRLHGGRVLRRLHGKAHAMGTRWRVVRAA